MSLRIALFGQAAFGVQTLERLRASGYTLAGVFAPPDAGRPEPLAARAQELGLPLVRRKFYRKKTGEPIAAALDEHAALGADLNVLASVQVFLPRALTDAPKHKSLCFHPSLLPRFRGGAALQWQIILGERETGVSIFVPDEGADTGPLVLQKGGVKISPTETTASLFFDKLQPLGIEALVEAVELVAQGRARPWAQDESRATHQGLVDDAVAAVDLSRSAAEIDRLVRGCDPQPGAFVRHEGRPLRLFEASLEGEAAGAPGTVLEVSDAGLALALRGGVLRVKRVRADSGAKEPARAFAERVGLSQGARLESGG
ncbi:MAG TPA: methionyl-tRNA formyltransferase [Myxococcota bacterium]|nr:methionyl-tRNA formyltransferase [Myxococcota bacterium]